MRVENSRSHQSPCARFAGVTNSVTSSAAVLTFALQTASVTVCTPLKMKSFPSKKSTLPPTRHGAAVPTPWGAARFSAGERATTVDGSLASAITTCAAVPAQAAFALDEHGTKLTAVPKMPSDPADGVTVPAHGGSTHTTTASVAGRPSTRVPSARSGYFVN